MVVNHVLFIWISHHSSPLNKEAQQVTFSLRRGEGGTQQDAPMGPDAHVHNFKLSILSVWAAMQRDVRSHIHDHVTISTGGGTWLFFLVVCRESDMIPWLWLVVKICPFGDISWHLHPCSGWPIRHARTCLCAGGPVLLYKGQTADGQINEMNVWEWQVWLCWC